MNYDDEEYDPYAGFNGGCPVHGEDYMRECTVCGAEFCTACFPNSDVCGECADQGVDLDDEAGDRIFREVDASLLRDAIAELPADMKEALMLRYFMDLPVSRVARILSAPQGTVPSSPQA